MYMTQTISKEEIARCRSVQIHLLVGDSRVNRQIKIKCPFHNENTASCNLFPNGGYKCYGCNNSLARPNHGDTIDFVMRLGATFPEALGELNKYL